jgi:hypothetical protein
MLTWYQTKPLADCGPPMIVPVVPAGSTASTLPEVLGLLRRLRLAVVRTEDPTDIPPVDVGVRVTVAVGVSEAVRVFVAVGTTVSVLVAVGAALTFRRYWPATQPAG